MRSSWSSWAASHRVAREHALRTLARRFDADVLLNPSLIVVDAHFDGSDAHWWGRREKVASLGQEFVDGFASLLTLGFADVRWRTIRALSLVVTIENVDGHEVYVNGSGLEVLEVRTTWGLAPRPEAELFADRERNTLAVLQALLGIPHPARARE